MATRTVVTRTDDLDGSTLEGGRPVVLSLDGIDYEIDLSPAHAADLHRTLAPYVAAAREPGAPARPEPRRVEVGVDRDAVRAWARAHDVAIPRTGHVPADVVEQFRAAGN